MTLRLAESKEEMDWLAHGFSDVDPAMWYAPYIAAAAPTGLMKGIGTDTFAPMGKVTLAETVTIAARLHSIYHTGSEQFVQETFAGSLPAFLAAFGSRKMLSDAEIKELTEVIEAMRR